MHRSRTWCLAPETSARGKVAFAPTRHHTGAVLAWCSSLVYPYPRCPTGGSCDKVNRMYLHSNEIQPTLFPDSAPQRHQPGDCEYYKTDTLGCCRKRRRMVPLPYRKREIGGLRHQHKACIFMQFPVHTYAGL